MKQRETAESRPQSSLWLQRSSAVGYELPIVGGLLTAAGYYLGVEVGANFTLAPQPVSTLWPPNAILFGALLLAPPRHWWVFILAVLPVHLSAQLTNGVSLSMSLLWFVSNVSEALIGAAGIRRYVSGPMLLDSSRQIALYFLFAFLATFVSSFMDASFVAVAQGAVVDYWGVWRTRFFSNILAMVTVTPVVVTLGHIDFEELRRTPLRRYLELAVLTVLLIAASVFVFNQHVQSGTTFMLLYILTPPLLWAALRFDSRIVTPLLLAVSLIAIDAAVKGHGPFESGSLLGNALAVQLFLLTAAVPILALVAVTQERSRAQDLACGNEERLNLALGVAQMGTLDWDLGTDRVSLSETARRMLGAPDAPPIVPMTFYAALVHPDDRAMFLDALADARARRSTYDVEYRVRAPGHDVRWIASKGKVIENKQGNAVRVLGVNIDVSDRKSNEKHELEQRQQLAHLSRVAVMGELSGALAHELNQPLTSIMNNAQAASLLLGNRPSEPNEMKEIMDDITDEAHRASEVIRHMRNFLRKGEVRFQLLDVNDTIREALALEYSDLLAKGISVHLDLAPDLPFIHADHVQVQQILLNLIANARDAMSDKAALDRVLTVASTHGEGGGVEILISDLGDGIPAEKRGEVFQPFFSTKSQGLGMGLAICRTIVNTHNGQLWLTDRVPHGTTFHVLLPSAPTKVQQPPDATDADLSPHELNDLLDEQHPIACEAKGARQDVGAADERRKLH